MTTHTITLARHTAQVVGLMGVLVLGTWDSYGTEQLLLRHGPEWDGLAIDATFHNVPNDEGVTVLADTDGLVTVPPEACMRASKYATITFRGVQDGVQRISCNLPYMVLDHAQVPGANSTATPSENAQALAQMQDLRDSAVDAKNQAEAARDGAANSATAAAGSEKAAASSAVAAAGSAAQAEAQKTAAASSATAAAGSATAAAGDAKTASDAAAGAVDAKAAAVAAQKDAAASKAAAKTSEDAAAKSAADADSTANSINNSMIQIAANKEAVSQLKEDTTALQKRQNVLVGSETGNPVSCDDAFAAPLCGLHVYGKSTQDGTPSPDNPVPIVSAGDDGSVAVKVTGANMLEGTKPGVESTSYGITYTTYENGVLITGTATGTIGMLLHEDITHRLTRGIYYLTTRGLSPSVMLNFYYVGKFSTDVQNQKVILTKDVDFSLRLQISIGATLNTTVQASLTRSKSVTYSPYREQLLTLPTPHGLPGIPVTSGGNYTDENGQQWICDEINLESEVKIQRVDKAAFDSTKTLAEQNAILATPVETPLTHAEIADYKALTAYAPDTVVQASDGAGVKLEYQRDVNIAIKNLEDAIASMTTT